MTPLLRGVVLAAAVATPAHATTYYYDGGTFEGYGKLSVTADTIIDTSSLTSSYGMSPLITLGDITVHGTGQMNIVNGAIAGWWFWTTISCGLNAVGLCNLSSGSNLSPAFTEDRITQICDSCYSLGLRVPNVYAPSGIWSTTAPIPTLELTRLTEPAPVPGPIMGTGLLGVLFACGVALASKRRLAHHPI